MKTRTKQTMNLVRGAILLLVLTGWFATPRLFRHWIEPTALAAPMTFVVNTAADADDGLCSSAASGCTLREAIKAANANAGTDTINFNIPGAGVKTIHLTSNLPTVTAPVIIDGYTQGLAHPNTLAAGNDAVLLIELDGSTDSDANTFTAAGLVISGGGCTVKGLVINRFAGTGILVGGGNNTIEGNFIGTDPAGTADLRCVTGLTVSSNGNTVGGTTPAARNLLSGNGRGVQISGGATGNLVRGNFIGTDASGASPLGNMLEGIFIVNASDNTIGGTSPGSGNLIAFNGGNGINILKGTSQSDTGNAILGNSIHSNIGLGIDLGGDGVTPNDPGDSDTGANNLQNFPVLTSATSNSTQTTVFSTFNSTPNTQFHLEFFSSPSCDPSGNGEGKKLIHSSNVLTGSGGQFGLSFLVPNAQLDGPYITATATDPLNNSSEFSNCIPALASTLVVNSTADTDDGACTVAAGGCTLREAINLANSDSLLNAINFNIPGSGVRTISPISALPNITEPVIIDGYTQPGSSPNTLADGDNAVLLIELNGADVGGVSGLVLKGGDSVVRGLAINRFDQTVAVAITGNGDNVIAGNFIGTNPAGTSALGNFNGVLVLNQSANRIGGQTPADRNVISGNLGTGILLGNPGATANLVQGNYIGTNAAGNAAIGNASGLNINDAPLNIIGGTTAGTRNVLSGNIIGVSISNDNANNNRVQGNFIGTDATGNGALGNTMAGVDIGVFLNPSGNIIGGGFEEGNRIAFNGGDGVLIRAGTGNTVTDNSIHSNGGLGIDLGGDGVTPNDGTGDFDSGANDLQNFPVLTSVTANGNALELQGTLNSNNFTKFTLRLFSSTSCDPSGNGEGETFIAAKFVTTDLNGSADFSFDLSASHSGRFITATATDPAGNTSEFAMHSGAVHQHVPVRPAHLQCGRGLRRSHRERLAHWRHDAPRQR